MTKTRTPRIHPVQDLVLTDQTRAGVLLRSRTAQVEIHALAPDLVHLRIRPHDTSFEPSWAVIRDNWPDLSVSLRSRRRTIDLTTEAATFRFHLDSGAWSYTDCHGIEIFRSPAGATAFAGAEAHLSLHLAEREAIFGLGESSGTFNKRGLIREFWNTDVLAHAPGIHPGLRALYVSIPFALSLRDGRIAGLFWDNPARQVWDIGQTRLDHWSMTAASGAIDLYLFSGPGAAPVLKRYSELTGRMPLPPRWALGYHQSRYSYESRRELEAVAAEFRRRHLPCDALYCDIHHMDRHRVFTFGKAFPRPAEMIRKLASHGFRVVTIVDPGVHDSRGFDVLRRGLKLDAFVKTPDGKQDVVGKVWPGPTRFPDFLNARVRTWWSAEQNRLLDLGVAGIWNDMNEPADFEFPGKTLDPESLHQTDHGPRRHREVHNVYGMEMARASQEGFLRRPGSAGASGSKLPAHRVPRPFVITRAGYAGVQRHALVWTGDNTSSWDHLSDSLQMLLNLGLSGVPFVGSDVGGFLDNTTPELFVRWLQMAIFTPFLRNHSNTGTIRQEPWSLGPEIEELSRTSLNLRYQLLPYLYGLFHEASVTGAPIMRPLVWHYPNDPIAAACSDQFLLGENLLIAPVLRQGTVARSLYLPRGEWFDFWTGEAFPGGVHIIRHAPLERIPVMVRAGTILPMTMVRPCIGPKEPEVVVLHLWPSDTGTLHWYDDDGQTQAFTTGHVQQRTLRTSTHHRGGFLEIGAAIGPYAGSTRRWRVVLRCVRREYTIRLNDKPIPSEFVEELAMQAFDLPAVPERSEARWR